jgi:hypothetical protein
VTAAIFGVAGVIVGALVTGAVTYIFERRRERREARSARLVVRHELEEATKAVEDALAGKEWPPGWQNMRWSQSWSTYRPVLAATMEEQDFAKLARAYLHMELLLAGFAAGKRGFVDADESFFAAAREHLAEAEKLFPLGR